MIGGLLFLVGLGLHASAAYAWARFGYWDAVTIAAAVEQAESALPLTGWVGIDRMLTGIYQSSAANTALFLGLVVLYAEMAVGDYLQRLKERRAQRRACRQRPPSPRCLMGKRIRDKVNDAPPWVVLGGFPIWLAARGVGDALANESPVAAVGVLLAWLVLAAYAGVLWGVFLQALAGAVIGIP